MRIYYPINDEEPTPALPKGGSLNEAQYSLTTNRLTSNGRHPPSFGEGLGMGFHSPLPWRLHRSVLRIKNPHIRLRRIAYPPEQIFLLPSLGVIDRVASLVEEWGRRSGYQLRRIYYPPEQRNWGWESGSLCPENNNGTHSHERHYQIKLKYKTQTT